MINCSKEISKFHEENVRLPEDQRGEMRNRRKSNQDRLKAGLKKQDNPLPKRHIKQGSYAMHTMVQPPDKHPKPDYDIDDGAVFDRDDLKGPQGGDMSPRDARDMVRDALDDGSFKNAPETLKTAFVSTMMPVTMLMFPFTGNLKMIAVRRALSWHQANGKNPIPLFSQLGSTMRLSTKAPTLLTADRCDVKFAFSRNLQEAAKLGTCHRGSFYLCLRMKSMHQTTEGMMRPCMT